MKLCVIPAAEDDEVLGCVDALGIQTEMVNVKARGYSPVHPNEGVLVSGLASRPTVAVPGARPG